MAVFQLGPIIRARREALGLSQEDLADGLCSVPTLSRIENGERMPTKNHFEMLLERLGFSSMLLDFYADKKNFTIQDMKFQIRQANVTKKYDLARALMAQLETMLPNPTPIDLQYILLHQVLLTQEPASPQRLEKLEQALCLTCPRYRTQGVPRVLTYEEILLLNNIAVCRFELGEHEQAISLLYNVRDYYDRHVIFAEEALRTQPMTLYNLSKYLGLTGQYDQCIEICDQGIRIARQTGRCTMLGTTLFNRAWALLERKNETDRSLAKQTLQEAYSCFKAMGVPKDMQFVSSYYQEVFGEPI